MDIKDTIVGPATSLGEGGISIVRLSGPDAENLLSAFFKPTKKIERMDSHFLYHGVFVDESGETVDEVMSVIMRAPCSYTREDVVEVHCHGGPIVTRRILDFFIEKGARLARPGEFTLRAFLNGRLDLTEAEAVIDVIHSRSEAACKVALRQMEGSLSSRIYLFRDKIIEILALVEAYIDFPEEDLELPHRDKMLSHGREVLADIQQLLDTFETGRVLREGISVLIIGKPNVGKSSLLNALLGETRAIVTEIPGTTRDTIEESLNFGGVPVRLVDTAGVRETSDPIEMEGVRRARKKADSADLVLLVLDGSKETDQDDLMALDACKGSRVLLVVNKTDLPQGDIPKTFTSFPAVYVSTQTGTGIDVLKKKITGFFERDNSYENRETVLISDRRHKEALLLAKISLERFLAALEEGSSFEFLALDLRECLEAFGEITGETTPEDVLNHIFSRFCVGK